MFLTVSIYCADGNYLRLWVKIRNAPGAGQFPAGKRISGSRVQAEAQERVGRDRMTWSRETGFQE
ncbi:MAG TPA: hypothetical protein DCZ91_24780 [Lachnospiraceae bacterium]|nr:hypothetical protein [Lachnospiraceae bacterium]